MHGSNPRQAAFPLGRIVITRHALDTLSPDEVQTALARHASGDWGNLGQEDAAENRRALERGCRIFSAYGQGDRTFWIITEADRSATTVLLPNDY